MLRLTALLCFLSINQPATAQDPRLAARLDSTTRVEVESVLAVARRRGLPVEPLVQKALEGSSKGASGPRIVAAVETMLGDLGRARDALGDQVTAGELVAG